jgi:transcriptional regulator with XRE-family HTH domain
MTTLPEAQRRVLGDFLRAQRARLSPTSLGLPMGGRRRTPGLRREEVAQACGMSATWYTWLEQGRDVSASPATLAGLAGALHLTPAERAYLFELAGKRDPSAPAAAPDGDGMDVPAALAQALASIDGPAYLLDRTWNARAWNPPAARLFVGWLDRPGDRNLLRYIFLSPLAPTLIPDWEHRARRVLAEFRADSSRHLDDPALHALVDDLSRRSPRFARWWTEHAVVERAGGGRRFDHPRDGRLDYEQIAFTMASRPDFTLVMLVARDRPASRAVEPRRAQRVRAKKARRPAGRT